MNEMNGFNELFKSSATQTGLIFSVTRFDGTITNEQGQDIVVRDSCKAVVMTGQYGPSDCKASNDTVSEKYGRIVQTYKVEYDAFKKLAGQDFPLAAEYEFEIMNDKITIVDVNKIIPLDIVPKAPEQQKVKAAVSK